jgi:hypothetical protein
MGEPEKTQRRPAKKARCAIYTRKSSEEGLEHAFNSLPTSMVRPPMMACPPLFPPSYSRILPISDRLLESLRPL